MTEPHTRSRNAPARFVTRLGALLRPPVFHSPRAPARGVIWVGVGVAIVVVVAIATPQLLGAREKARNATADNIYVALNGEVANELDGALNGGTGQLGPLPAPAIGTGVNAIPPALAAAVVPPPTTALRAARTVVYSGEMALTALDVRRAASRVVQIVEGVGGIVVAQTLSGGRNEPASAMLSLRVPTATFQPLTDRIATLGYVEHQSSKAVDQTEDQVDVDARLAAKRALESRLIALLGREPASLADTLAVEKELARVREEIEALAGRGAGITSRVELAALEVRIDEATGAARGFRGRLAERAAEARAAFARLADTIGRLAADGLLLALPIGLAALAAIAWTRRRRRAIESKRTTHTAVLP